MELLGDQAAVSIRADGNGNEQVDFRVELDKIAFLGVRFAEVSTPRKAIYTHLHEKINVVPMTSSSLSPKGSTSCNRVRWVGISASRTKALS